MYHYFSRLVAFAETASYASSPVPTGGLRDDDGEAHIGRGKDLSNDHREHERREELRSTIDVRRK